MHDEYNKRLVEVSMSELLIIKSFKMYTIGRINENLAAYGVDALPSILYILSCGMRLDYTVENVRVTPDFVEKIIDGYMNNVVAFAYTHRLIATDKNGEETKKVGVYYEDNVVRITHYHIPVFSVLTNSYAISEQPDESKYNEYHPAMCNISNLLSIN